MSALAQTVTVGGRTTQVIQAGDAQAPARWCWSTHFRPGAPGGYVILGVLENAAAFNAEAQAFLASIQ